VNGEFLIDPGFSVENPLTEDPNVRPPGADLPEPVTDPQAAIDVAVARLRDLWNQQKRPADRPAVWPLILAGLAIGLLINRRS